MLRSKHGRREGDDRIIVNDGHQYELDELTEAPHKKTMDARCSNMLKKKTAKDDEDDQ